MSEHAQAMANSILQATAAKSGPTPDLGPSRWVKFHSFKKATWSSGSGPSGASDMGVISSAAVKSGSGLVVDTGKLQLPPERAIGSRLRLLSQGKRAEEAGMISLTTKTRAHIQTQIKLRLITASLPKRAK